MNRIFFIALLTFSIHSNAATNQNISSKVDISLAALSSKQEAYELGHKKLSTIQDLDEQNLRSTLRVADMDYIKKSLSITNAKVTVEEFSTTLNTVQFKPIVTVNYSYSIRDNN